MPSEEGYVFWLSYWYTTGGFPCQQNGPQEFAEEFMNVRWLLWMRGSILELLISQIPVLAHPAPSLNTPPALRVERVS